MNAIAHRPLASRRFWNAALAGLCGCVFLAGLAVAQPPSITVTSGSVESVPGTHASGTYASVTVSGTGAAGERSTLTIDAPLQMGQDFDGGNQVLSVTDGGLLNVNANVTAATSRSGTVGNGGTLNLLSGTFQLTSLDLSGTAAFQRAPGAVWAIDSLSLSDGATVTYTAGDLWGGGDYYPFLGISSGATLELQTNLVAPEGHEIFLTGSGSRILRATGTETISGGNIGVADGANFTLIAGDTPVSLVAGELYITPDPVAPSAITLAPGTTTLNLSFLGLGSGGSIVGLADASYNVKAVSVAGQQLDYRPGDTIAEYVSINTSGTLSLQKNLTLSGSYAELALRGTTSTLERNAYDVSTPAVYVVDGANLTIGEAITVSRRISVNDGFDDLPTSVTLTEHLVLAASDGVNPSISVTGSNAGVLRASPGLTITATGAEITAYEQGTFTMEAGDDFTGSSVTASMGGIIANAGPQTLASVYVYGTSFDSPSSYTAYAPLTLTGGEFTTALDVQYGGVFTANANVTAPGVSVVSGTLNLVTGTLAVSESLYVSGSAASVTRAPASVISAPATAVSISDLASFTMEENDSFTGSTLTVTWGGTAANAGPQTLAQVTVYGKNIGTDAAATYMANAPLVISGTGSSALSVGDGGVFRSDANVTVGGVSVSGGTLDLVSGTFEVANSLAVSGTMLVNRAGGAAYQVGDLSLSDGASLDFVAGTDSIASLFLGGQNLIGGFGGFLTTTGSGGLTLTSLSILSDGLLTLDSFDGVGGPGAWALKLPDSYASLLSTYISGSSIVGGSGQPLNVIQQDGFAYVTAVPEPSAVVLALGGVGIAAGLLRRRSRAARRSQSAATTSGAVER
jgi:hypothetical protein